MKTGLRISLLIILAVMMLALFPAFITAQAPTATPTRTPSRTPTRTGTAQPTRTPTPSGPNDTLEVNLGDDFSPDLVAAVSIGTQGQRNNLNCGISITDGSLDYNFSPTVVADIPDFRAQLPSICSNTPINDSDVTIYTPNGSQVNAVLFTFTDHDTGTQTYAAGLPLGAILTPGEYHMVDAAVGSDLVITIDPIFQTIFFRGSETTGILAGFQPNEAVRAFAFTQVNDGNAPWQFAFSFEFAVNQFGYRVLKLSSLKTVSIIFVGQQQSSYISNGAFQTNGSSTDPRQLDPDTFQKVWSAQPGTVFATAAPYPTANPSVVERTDGHGVTQVYVPAGCFTMGSNALSDLTGQIKSQTERQVCISQPFWIDKYEVTNAQWEQFRTETGSPLANVLDYDTSPQPDSPRVGMTLAQAEAYALWRAGHIPTEAEWEYAARGPDTRMYPWGNIFSGEANVASGTTYPVTDFPAGTSWVGAFNMSGNAGEWVSDCYNAYYDGQNVTNDPVSPCDGTNEMVKGSSFGFDSIPAQIVYRFVNPPNHTWFDVGLRVVSPAS